MKKLLIPIIPILFSLLILVSAKPILAIENPLLVPNNRFGIHIIDESDLEDATHFVNSEGGDWGYITLVIREDERNIERWQEVFDTMRRQHLIPIVRIATKQVNSHWKKPVIDEIDSWVHFLNSLNWVVKNRYVIIGNEPNHAKEWGQEISPEEYGQYLAHFSEKLKFTNKDFFILPAGLDASAPTDKDHLSETEFIRRMLADNENVFDYIDGWNSHSYPNPNFSGSENASGRGTVRTFEWELEYLKNLGVEKELPIFITETGWAHNMEGNVLGYKTPSAIAINFKTAFENAWNNEKIVAITPFILNYQSPPFDIFSWKKADGSFYDFYYEVQKMPKPKGEPVQINTAEVPFVLVPEMIKRDGNKFGIAYVENTGQVIWERDKKYVVDETEGKMEIEPVSFCAIIEPNDKTFAYYRYFE
ncbi:hypothetical protein KKB40_04550 [Patescibacteria group bacterium]|nr:hypothetical protein [Patescibacteria group bacterium]